MTEELPTVYANNAEEAKIIATALGIGSYKIKPTPTNDVPGSDPDAFQNKAKEIVRRNYVSIETALNDDAPALDISEIYVAWFSKVLGNWKAVLGTTRPDGQYFEVTYNGANGEAYLDTYVKTDNVCVSDFEYHKD